VLVGIAGQETGVLGAGSSSRTGTGGCQETGGAGGLLGAGVSVHLKAEAPALTLSLHPSHQDWGRTMVGHCATTPGTLNQPWYPGDQPEHPGWELPLATWEWSPRY